MLRLTNDELRIGALLYPERGYWRPTTRGQCANVQRPCPYVACRHHLYLDVNTWTEVEAPAGMSYTIPSGAEHPWDLVHSCSLDLAELDMMPGREKAMRGMTLEEVGAVLGITRERVRQIETKALAELRRKLPELGDMQLSDLFGSDAVTPWDEMLVS